MASGAEKTRPRGVAREGDAGRVPASIADDLLPLRVGAEWRAAEILKRFGPAESDAEYLARILVACAVLQGAIRVRDLVDRLLGHLKGVEPRVLRLSNDPALARHKTALKKVVTELASARPALLDLRARVLNDLAERPAGLRLLDLRSLSEQTGNVALAFELSNKQNVTGVAYAQKISSRIPDQRHAESWIGRALGAALPEDLLLFTPPEYGRVVVVHSDGRLAYDPKPSPR